MSPRSSYRGNLPLLLAGTYASVVSVVPVNKGPLAWGTLGVALVVLWLSPLARTRRVQLLWGLYLFVAVLAAHLVLFPGPRSVPLGFRVLGWVAYILSWGGLPLPGDSGAAASEALGARILEPRRRAPMWPFFVFSVASVVGLGLFLWPAGDLLPAKVVLLRVGVALYCVGLLGFAADALGAAVLGEGRRGGRFGAAVGVVAGLGSLAVEVRAIEAWTHGRDLEAILLGVFAAALLLTGLRLRRNPRTKVEL